MNGLFQNLFHCAHANYVRVQNVHIAFASNYRQYITHVMIDGNFWCNGAILALLMVMGWFNMPLRFYEHDVAHAVYADKLHTGERTNMFSHIEFISFVHFSFPRQRCDRRSYCDNKRSAQYEPFLVVRPTNSVCLRHSRETVGFTPSNGIRVKLQSALPGSVPIQIPYDVGRPPERSIMQRKISDATRTQCLVHPV